jgi:hypothetical protein
MIAAGSGGSPVVAVDPAELDSAAGRLRGQSLDASELVCRLRGAADGVDMPPEVQGRVRAAVDSAVAGLDGLGGRLDTLADFARARSVATRKVDDPTTVDAAFVALLAGGRALERYRPYLKRLDGILGKSGRLLDIAGAAAQLRASHDGRQLRTSPDPAERSRAGRDLPRSAELARRLDRIRGPLRPIGDLAGIAADRADGKSWPDIILHRGSQAAGGAAGDAASVLCGPWAPACAVPLSETGAEIGDRFADGAEEIGGTFLDGLKGLGRIGR